MMTTKSPLIAQLIRAANRIETVRSDERRHLFKEAFRVYVRCVRDSAAAPNLRAVGRVMECHTVSQSLETASDWDAAAAMLTMAEVLRDFRISLTEQYGAPIPLSSQHATP